MKHVDMKLADFPEAIHEDPQDDYKSSADQH